tara:strand:+ start:3991 stop:4689 length:699 start_codon:yes stop_codon:yes gene_type:complete
MELFYNKNISIKTTQFHLDGIENKHINKVLRKKQGDLIIFTNGKNLKFKVKIIKLSKKSSLFKVLSFEKVLSNKNLHVAISILKSPARFEIFLEKAVEIGVSEITPIICKRTLRKRVKIERCNKIIISALKQSFKYHLPKFNSPIAFKDFIKSSTEKNKLIATCEELKKESLGKSFKQSETNVILIGPEGDFTKEELKEAKINKFKFVSLGNSRLRAETAGIMSCAIFSTIK